MTAGEADVNSSIRFQSACTVSTLLRNEGLLKTSPPPMTKSLKNVRKQLLFSAQVNPEDAFAAQCSRLWCFNNHERPAEARRCFFGMKSSCQIAFDALSVGESRRLLRCPPGSGEQSGFGISHSLNSQGLWPSADSTANCSLIPSPLLFGQLWIFDCYESNSVRHATVQPHSVSGAVCRMWRETLTRTSPFFSSTIRFDDNKRTVRWPKYNILDISFFPSSSKQNLIDDPCDGAPLLSKTIHNDHEHGLSSFKITYSTPSCCSKYSQEEQCIDPQLEIVHNTFNIWACLSGVC